jgi:hypothetical protein
MIDYDRAFLDTVSLRKLRIVKPDGAVFAAKSLEQLVPGLRRELDVRKEDREIVAHRARD